MKIVFWGTRGSLPTPLNGSAVRRKVVNALVKGAGAKLDTIEKARAFADSLPFAVGNTFGGNSSCVELNADGTPRVLLDIGSIEHVFDTLQVCINYLSLIKPGGHLCLHLPVSGYYGHGFHTFSPELVRGVLVGNGCEITFTAFSDFRGNAVNEDALRGVDALMWVVARKLQTLAEFRIPQQAGWREHYEP